MSPLPPHLIVINIFLSPLLLLLLFILDIDISKLQPPEIEAPANGSSHSTGGFSHGCALGIAPNIGDPFGDIQQVVRPLS